MKFVKTAVVEAVQWTGENIDEILELIPGAQPVYGTNGFLSVYDSQGGWEVDLSRGSYVVVGGKDWITSVDEDEFREQYKRVDGVAFPEES